MQRDMRDTAFYREAEAIYKAMRGPAAGAVSDATEIHAAPDGRHAVFTGTIVEQLEGTPPTRICQVDLATGAIQVLTSGPNVDRLPKYSPDGRQVAFLSDRHTAGDFQLYLLELSTGACRATPAVEGWIEYLHWSPDGERILLGVAGQGADVAGAQGAVSSKRSESNLPAWVPSLDIGDEDFRWRRAWVYEAAANSVRPVARPDLNVWEATWCGNHALAMVASPAPGEGFWYNARLHVVALKTNVDTELYVPRDQLGWPSATPSGELLAVVEAICSDRWLVAGELRLIETSSARVYRVDTQGVEITHCEWRSDQTLLVAGHRGFETVVGVCDARSRAFTELWSSRELTTGGYFAVVSGLNDTGDCLLIGESFTRAPEVAEIRRGDYRCVKSFDRGYAEFAKAIAGVECPTWKAPDGLEIQGWLLRPQGEGPHPLVMNIHGGPVWHWRPTWLGRWGAAVLMLLARGYAVFFPNPRGSTGRGQHFASLVVGDMGGADSHDFLSGLDFLVEQRLADPQRLGVMGGSYGGFMTAWLVTQDARFAAAIPVAPITNLLTEHLVSNIPHFVRLFVADDYANPRSRYFHRSPIMHVRNVKTPTLNIGGALDRCTPPQEAVQFHNALLEHGARSALVIYPQEGHGIRQFPATIDYAARVVSWFHEHMAPARSSRQHLPGEISS